MVRLEVPGHVLQHFWDLANIDAETRRESAVNLVNELSTEASSGFVHGILAAIAKNTEVS